MPTPKILLFDIETMPNKVYTWGMYEQNVIDYIQPWYIISVAFKWLEDRRIKAYALPDFQSYKKNPTDDKQLCIELWKLFDEADVIVAHNGNSFDIKKVQARFVEHGLKPPRLFKSVDTKLVAKKYFKFDSNKLNDIAKYLNIGRKINTGGFELWLDCERGDTKAWRKMVKYNKRDVELLEKVYLKLRPWIDNHPNYNLYVGTNNLCPNCGSDKITKNGKDYTRTGVFQQYRCGNCGHQSRKPIKGDLIR